MLTTPTTSSPDCLPSANAPKPRTATIPWIIERLTILAVGYGSPRDVSAERLRLYAENLADLTPASINRAMGRALKTLKVFSYGRGDSCAC